MAAAIAILSFLCVACLSGARAGPTTCPEDKEYQECGTACPLTCDNIDVIYGACIAVCVEGCFCPEGLVEYRDGCVESSQCPNTTCPEGKEYQDCGSACPLTCDNYFGDDLVCTLQCVAGCFCRNGLPEYDGGCIHPLDCPNRPEDPCSSKECPDDYICRASDVTGRGVCEPSCEGYAGCPADKVCSIESLECSLQPCDNYRARFCRDPIPDFCPPDADDCPSTSRCLSLNATGESICLQSCFLENGGCNDDEFCITSERDTDCDLSEPCSSVRCVETADFAGRCPPHKRFTDCGAYPACQSTCDNYQELLICPEICAPGCVCAPGLVEFRDSCVDPLECPALLEDPPAISPLPQRENEMVLIQLTVTGMSRQEFANEQDGVVTSIEMILQQEGYDNSDVDVSLYAVVEANGNLQVVLQFTGAAIRSERLKVNDLASFIADSKDTLSVQVAEVSGIEIPDVQSTGLSDGAIAGIVIGVVVAAIAIILVIVIVLVYIMYSHGKKQPEAKDTNEQVFESKPKDTTPTAYSKLQEVAKLENEYVES